MLTNGNADSGFQAQARGFGLLGPDLTPRPAYAVLQSLANQNIQERGGRVLEG